MDFLTDTLKKIAHKNYKYIEILLGNQISNNIFNSKIDKVRFNNILQYFKKKLEKYSCKTIVSKNYEFLNKRLNINEEFQQRCFEQTLIDKTLYNHESGDKVNQFMITFGEKKMISIGWVIQIQRH